MFATFSSERRVQERMAALGLSAANLAVVSGISATKISNAFRGLREFDSIESTKLLAVTSELIELVEAVRPLQLPTNAADLARILDHLRREQIPPDRVREAITRLFEANQSA